jgi:hypothetical protein
MKSCHQDHRAQIGVVREVAEVKIDKEEMRRELARAGRDRPGDA